MKDYLFGGTHSKDYRASGSILGSPDLWKLPNGVRTLADLYHA